MLWLCVSCCICWVIKGEYNELLRAPKKAHFKWKKFVELWKEVKHVHDFEREDDQVNPIICIKVGMIEEWYWLLKLLVTSAISNLWSFKDGRFGSKIMDRIWLWGSCQMPFVKSQSRICFASSPKETSMKWNRIKLVFSVLPEWVLTYGALH